MQATEACPAGPTSSFPPQEPCTWLLWYMLLSLTVCSHTCPEQCCMKEGLLHDSPQPDSTHLQPLDSPPLPGDIIIRCSNIPLLSLGKNKLINPKGTPKAHSGQLDLVLATCTLGVFQELRRLCPHVKKVPNSDHSITYGEKPGFLWGSSHCL